MGIPMINITLPFDYSLVNNSFDHLVSVLNAVLEGDDFRVYKVAELINFGVDYSPNSEDYSSFKITLGNLLNAFSILEDYQILLRKVNYAGLIPCEAFPYHDKIMVKFSPTHLH